MRHLYIFTGLLLIILSASFESHAAVFNVNDVTGLYQALIDATNNTEDDTVNIASGTYITLGGPFAYGPATPGFGNDNHSINIQGAGSGSTILSGGSNSRVLLINTTNLGDDSNVNITVNGLTLQDGNSDFGGGLHVETNNAGIEIIDSEFINNSVSKDGGGVFIESSLGRISFLNNKFTNNNADQSGGGIFTLSALAPVKILNNTFNNNGANAGGGISLLSEAAPILFSNNTFINNSALTLGAGMAVQTLLGTTTITNNIFNNNSSGDQGGGIFVFALQATQSITNNTLINNSAVNIGGGLYIGTYSFLSITNIFNNIVWGSNLGPANDRVHIDDDLDTDNFGSLVNLYNNLYRAFSIDVGDKLLAANNIIQDPIVTSDFHLKTGSPCIDSGSNNAPGLPSEDFEGDQRIEFGTVDMGADEYVELPVPTTEDTIAYLPVENPVRSSSPFLSRPFSVGNVNAGTLSLKVDLPVFSGNVDVYLGIYAPSLNPEVWIIKSDLSLQAVSDGVEAYKVNTKGPVSVPLYGDIDISMLPTGIYYLYVVVTPTGDQSSWYIWQTYFVVI